MSMQLNYFGGQDSIRLISQKLFEVYGFFKVVELVSTNPIGADITLENLDVSMSVKHRSLAVLPGEMSGRIELRDAPGGLKRIDLQHSFAFEWTPATLTGGMATVGRFYASIADDRIRKPLNRFFTLIKRECQPFTHGHRFWIFPEARESPFCQGWVGKPFDNPLFIER